MAAVVEEGTSWSFLLWSRTRVAGCSSAFKRVQACSVGVVFVFVSVVVRRSVILPL